MEFTALDFGLCKYLQALGEVDMSKTNHTSASGLLTVIRFRPQS